MACATTGSQSPSTAGRGLIAGLSSCLDWLVEPVGIEVGASAELAVVLAVEIVVGPHFAIAAGTADVDAGAVGGVKKEGGLPAVDELAVFVDSGGVG